MTEQMVLMLRILLNPDPQRRGAVDGAEHLLDDALDLAPIKARGHPTGSRDRGEGLGALELHEPAVEARDRCLEVIDVCEELGARGGDLDDRVKRWDLTEDDRDGLAYQYGGLESSQPVGCSSVPPVGVAALFGLAVLGRRRQA